MCPSLSLNGKDVHHLMNMTIGHLTHELVNQTILHYLDAYMRLDFIGQNGVLSPISTGLALYWLFIGRHRDIVSKDDINNIASRTLGDTVATSPTAPVHPCFPLLE